MPSVSLIPDRQLTFSPELAETIGLEEAVLLQALGEELADRNRVTPLVGMWTPNVLLLITGIYLTLNTVRDRASFNWPWKKKAKEHSNDSK